jgi:hypothetical protein
MIGLNPHAGVIPQSEKKYIYVCGSNIVIADIEEKT